MSVLGFLSLKLQIFNVFLQQESFVISKHVFLDLVYS